MSESPTPYNLQSTDARVETLEHQIVQVTEVQVQNTNAIGALVNAIDRLRSGVDSHFLVVEARLTAMESQLAALNQSNQLLADLLATRLPPPSSPKE